MSINSRLALSWWCLKSPLPRGGGKCGRSRLLGVKFQGSYFIESQEIGPFWIFKVLKVGIGNPFRGKANINLSDFFRSGGAEEGAWEAIVDCGRYSRLLPSFEILLSVDQSGG